jgi:ATP-dependent DNA ligase
MPLARLDAPFEHPDWIFEPKLDGFRAVAYVEGGASGWYRATGIR